MRHIISRQHSRDHAIYIYLLETGANDNKLRFNSPGCGMAVSLTSLVMEA